MASRDEDKDPENTNSHAQRSSIFSSSKGQKSIGRSTTMFVPSDSWKHQYERDETVVSHTGPLEISKAVPRIHRTGSLYSSRDYKNALPSGNPFESNRNPAKIDRVNAFLDNHDMSEEPTTNDGLYAKDNIDESSVTTNTHLTKSGLLGRCNDPFCVTCPAYNVPDSSNKKKTNVSSSFDPKIPDLLNQETTGWFQRCLLHISSCIPGTINPHSKGIQRWNKFFVLSCLLAAFIDPLFFFPLRINRDAKCMLLDEALAIKFTIIRTVTDFIYFMHMLLQFRVAYVAEDSSVVDSGDLITDPKKVVRHYMSSRYFWIDLFVVVPLPQIMILVVLPKYLKSDYANYGKNLLRAAILVQYLPRLYRVIPFAGRKSDTVFIFETAFANFLLNLMMFILCGHVVGSLWYLFGLQRVFQCLRNACRSSNLVGCNTFLDCGPGSDYEFFSSQPSWADWKNNSDANNCLAASSGSFQYGIYGNAVSITMESSSITRYVYSLFWGFQQISTLAGNQTPSSFVWEVLFTMFIIGLGLLLFALLIGNMQSFLQYLGRRRLEMQLRRHDFERWMSFRRLPPQLRSQVRQSERYNWSVTQGVDENELMKNLPEGLQREIRRHLFESVSKVRILRLMGDTVLDSIRERLKQKLFISGCEILHYGSPIERMFFIVRGQLECKYPDNCTTSLTQGDTCGEELFTWCLKDTTVDTDVRRPRLLSNRTVTCSSNVEAFILNIRDIEEVVDLFAKELRNPRVQKAIRRDSTFWRNWAAVRIQVAWRYRIKKKLAARHLPNIPEVN